VDAGYLHPTGFDTKGFLTKVAKDAVGIAKANVKYDKYHRPEMNQILGSAYDLNAMYAHHFVTRSAPRGDRPEVGSAEAGGGGVPSKADAIRQIKADPSLIRIVVQGLQKLPNLQ
jgi:hypothetical protein